METPKYHDVTQTVWCFNTAGGLNVMTTGCSCQGGQLAVRGHRLLHALQWIAEGRAVVVPPPSSR